VCLSWHLTGCVHIHHGTEAPNLISYWHTECSTLCCDKLPQRRLLQVSAWCLSARGGVWSWGTLRQWQKHSFKAHNFWLPPKFRFEHFVASSLPSAFPNTACTCCALLLRRMDGLLITRFNSVSSARSDLRAVTRCNGRALGNEVRQRLKCCFRCARAVTTCNGWNAPNEGQQRLKSELRAVSTCDGCYVVNEGEQCDSQHLSCF
jgi:hypothetical protein